MRIEAKELRLNNYLIVAGEYGKLTCISQDGLSLASKKSLYVFEGYNDVEPIILSPDILVKCGFENNGAMWANKYGIELLSFKGNIFFNIGNRRNHIGFVHQLQNLVFVTCGHELEINL